jgi:signal transduction histidine kinase
VHESVFAKLVAIMVTMAASLLVLVGAFFWFIVSPNLHTSIDRVLDEYTRSLAATSPDFETAKGLSTRLNLQVRYEGPDGSWSTVSDLPRIDDVRQGRVPGGSRVLLRRNYYVAAAPNGGAYLFAWSFGGRMREAHVTLLVLLLLLMAAVVVTTYTVLTRLLRPLRGLSDGVARLSAGQLDVALPGATRDEFGRLTEAFNHMVGRVRAMIGARDQLLLDVSHELRSPLTRMKVALELLPECEQRTRMAADVAEMDRMIAELLELERLRGGRGLEIARQDLLPILREVAESFQHKPPGVRVVAPSREILVDIDGDRVRTVLRNLLENATKYSLPQSRPVEISAVHEGAMAVVRVTDDGPGIPERDVERVFEPFVRVDRSRSKSTGGYGLGLSICKRVMQAHGGDIALERQRGRGASFILTFPKSA